MSAVHPGRFRPRSGSVRRWSRRLAGITAAVLVASAVTSARSGNTALAAGTPYPYSGQFSHVLDTANIGGQNTYVNDHTLIKDRQGTWHLFGIQGATAGAGLAPDSDNERSFIHATAPSLTGSWSVKGDGLTAVSGSSETHLWAPHVVEA